MTPRIHATVGRLPLAALWACVLAVLVCYLAGISRGFDFTDEGFYYVSFAHPGNVVDSQTSFHLFGALVYRLVGQNLALMRVGALLAAVGGAAILLWGMRPFVQRFSPDLFPHQDEWRLVWLAALVVSPLGFAISPAALSYNIQNAFCLQAATGLLLYGAAQPPTDRWFDRRTSLAIAGFGLLAGIDFFIKFSTSVPLAIAGAGLLLLTSQRSLRHHGALALVLFVCGAVSVLVYFGWLQDFTAWWHSAQATARTLLGGNYVWTEIRQYRIDFIELMLTALRRFTPVWVVTVPVIAIAAALRVRRRWQAFIAAVGAGLVLLTLIWLAAQHRYDSVPDLSFYVGGIGLLLLLIAGSRLSVPEAGIGRMAGRWRVVVAGGFLLVLPYVGAFGTNNEINRNCIYQLAPWFVVAGLLLGEINLIWHSSWPGRIGMLGFAAVAAIQFYHGYWESPYRVAGSREDQTVPVRMGLPDSSTLQVTPKVADFLSASRRVLEDNGYRPGDDLLVLFNLPGFVFAMGGQSPGHPWYYQGNAYQYGLNLSRLNRIEPERRRRAFVIRNSVDKDWNDFQPYLRQAGLNFPDDYRLISPSLNSPYTGVPFEIWKPRNRDQPPVQ